MSQFINLTPHSIIMNDGTEFKPCGQVARVGNVFTDEDGIFCRQEFGEVENLPEVQEGVFYIVSAIVFSATSRKDVVAPATGHQSTKRNKKGHILSVPFLIRK